MNAKQRGDLSERMLPVAAHLSCLAHGDGGQRDIAQALARLADGEKDALIVVLAGLVPPNVPLSWLLGYVTWDEDGRPAEPPTARETLQDLAEEYEPTRTPRYVDEAAVLRALDGDDIELASHERTAAVVRGMTRGMSASRVAERLGMTEKAVKRSWERSRERARDEGRKVPQRPAWAVAA